MSNRNTIIRDIFAVATIDELRDINLALKQRWNELDARVALNFKVGDSVKFNAKRRGSHIGIVKKVNRKTVSVLVGNTTWRVTPSLLAPMHENAAA
jgi:hypothetical protein